MEGFTASGSGQVMSGNQEAKSISWKEFGQELGLSGEFCDELRNHSSLSNDDRLEKVLCKLSESQSSEVSWDRIIKNVERARL